MITLLMDSVILTSIHGAFQVLCLGSRPGIVPRELAGHGHQGGSYN